MNKKRPILVAFRVSEKENDLLNQLIKESGLSKQDYLRLRAFGINIEQEIKSEAYLLQKRLEGYEALLKKIFEEKEM